MSDRAAERRCHRRRIGRRHRHRVVPIAAVLGSDDPRRRSGSSAALINIWLIAAPYCGTARSAHLKSRHSMPARTLCATSSGTDRSRLTVRGRGAYGGGARQADAIDGLVMCRPRAVHFSNGWKAASCRVSRR